MKRSFRNGLVTGLVVVFAAWFFDPATAVASSSEAGRYHALVIGNNDYKHLQRLQTAVSDAAAVAELLKLKYGFEVTLLLNASRSDILKAVNQLRADLTERDRLLVYYAGHGELDRQTQTGYWLPVDAEPEDDTNWIANESLTRHFRAMSARHVMVVADSCYSGALVRSSGGAPKTGSERDEWLRRMNEKRARTALVSGGLEPVADAGRNGHSVFANAFLEALRENGDILDGERLFQRVRQQVVLNADQTPQYSDMRRASHEGGDFLFRPLDLASPQPAAKAPAPAGPDARTIELTYWDSVKGSDDPEVVGAYLAKYPDGEFAALARIRIASLQRGRQSLERQRADAERQAAVRREQAAWQAVSSTDSIAALDAFLQQFPNGENAAMARIRMAELRSAEQRRREEALRQAAEAARRAQASGGAGNRMVASLASPSALQAIGDSFDGRWEANGDHCFQGAMYNEIELTVKNGKYSADLDAFVTLSQIMNGSNGAEGPNWRQHLSGQLMPFEATTMRFGNGRPRPYLNLSVTFPDGPGSTPVVAGNMPAMGKDYCTLKVTKR